MIQLPPDFSDLLQEFNAAKVEYLVVGGYAVMFHGYPRATKDLDIWVNPTPQNAHTTKYALRAFGAPPALLAPVSFLDPKEIFYLGVPPLRIEIFVEIPGVSFTQCYAQRVEATIQGIRVPFIDLANLRRNKQASGRPRDLDDLANLP